MGVLAIGFEVTWPEGLTRQPQHGVKVPGDAGGTGFEGGDLRAGLDQVDVAGGGHGDVLWKDRRAQHVAGAVHGIDAIENGDGQTRLLGGQVL